MTVKEMSDLLRTREVSSEELTRQHLDRIDATESSIKSFLAITPDIAMDQAKKADIRLRQGPSDRLTGIPMGLKDNLSTQGIPTTCGSKMLEAYVPPYDATVVRKLGEAGAVLLGKGNMDEFAMGSSTENSAFGITRNPWDPSRVPGGSSGGPAAAVAAGQIGFSLGSDTGGSIRQPAALCGIVGIKPTYGLVSRFGLIAYGSSLDQIGPLTRSVEDCAIVMNSICGNDPKDSTSATQAGSSNVDYTMDLNQGIKGLRIGVAKEYFGAAVDEDVARVTLEAIRILEGLGAEVDWEVSLPLTEVALAAYYVLAPSECSANLARYDGVKYGFSDPDADSMWTSFERSRQIGFGPEVKRRILLGTYALSAGYYDEYYLKAQKIRTLIKQEFDRVFESFDVLATPTSPTVAFRLGARVDDPVAMHASDICTVPANIAGIPGLSIPCGFVDQLPVGLQLLGPHFAEKDLFRVGFSYQQATGWHLEHPSL